VEFLDLSTADGMKIYQRSVTFLLIRAAKDIMPDGHVIVNHSISKGFHCEFEGPTKLTCELLEKIEQRMRELVDQDIPIEKISVPLDEAMKIFEENGMEDKKQLFKYRRASRVNLYKLGWLMNYFYGYMVPSTGYLKLFRLMYDAPGFIFQFPTTKEPDRLPKYMPQEKLSQILMEHERWGRILRVDTVAALNDLIADQGIGDLIRISEALHEKKIAQIADKIADKKDTVGVVLIAGPSSSGKTTFAQRLAIQLRVNGMRPHAISIDDYFVNREFTPIDENGEYDFEALEAIDVKLFNEHLTQLLNGEIVEIPSFNFKTGRREYHGRKIKKGPNDILIVEGIHGLNEKLTAETPKENKFKIYISALTQLNIDDHNRIPTTDIRLLRRIVRDNQFRGFDAQRTIELWPSVRRGEERNIFPFQEEADIMFNSALVYEAAVLKQFAEPLLFKIDRSSCYYSEAKRLFKFLDFFLGVNSEEIPNNSIIRELIGGSCFR
jgi:uridine kinase